MKSVWSEYVPNLFSRTETAYAVCVDMKQYSQLSSAHLNICCTSTGYYNGFSYMSLYPQSTPHMGPVYTASTLISHILLFEMAFTHPSRIVYHPEGFKYAFCEISYRKWNLKRLSVA